MSSFCSSPGLYARAVIVRAVMSLGTAGLLCHQAGCHSAHREKMAAQNYFVQGDAEQAMTQLDEAAEVRGAEQNLIRIDRALVHLMQGDSGACEDVLRHTRSELDYLRQKDLKEQTAAVLTDDKAVAWTGREFESRMIDSVLILASLMGDHQDAFAYAAQAMEHVDEDRTSLTPDTDEPVVTTVGHSDQSQSPAPPAPARMAANALATYLHAAVHSEHTMDADLTDRSLQQVHYWSGMDGASQPPIVMGTETRQAHGVLHVVTFVGRVTDWQQERVAPTSAALLIADQILSAAGDHTLPPTIAPVKSARPVSQMATSHQFTAAAVEGVIPTAVPGHVLLDVNAAAWDSYQNDRDQQIARAVARRVIKKGAVYAAKDQFDVGRDSALDVVLNVGGIAWEAMEKADTRHVSLLPERVEVLQLELPEGRHSVALSVVDEQSATANVGAESTAIVDITDGRNTFVICYRNGCDITRVSTGH